jgi:hypothetical protein
MALGIVSDDIFEQELEKFLPAVIVPPKTDNRGRFAGTETTPDSIRKVIGDTHLEGGVAAGKEMAELFGLTTEASRAYKDGKLSLTGRMAENLGPHIAKTKERIARKAGRIAIHALSAITDEKLSEAKAGELANVARAASSIVKDMVPETESHRPQNLTQIVLHAPKMASEDKYDVIDVVSTEIE